MLFKIVCNALLTSSLLQPLFIFPNKNSNPIVVDDVYHLTRCHDRNSMFSMSFLLHLIWTYFQSNLVTKRERKTKVIKITLRQTKKACFCYQAGCKSSNDNWFEQNLMLENDWRRWLQACYLWDVANLTTCVCKDRKHAVLHI